MKPSAESMLRKFVGEATDVWPSNELCAAWLREIAATCQASEPAGLLSSEVDWTVVDCPHCNKCVTYSKKDASSKIAYRDLCAEIDKLKELRQLHAGDTKSLSNELELMQADRDRLAAELAEAELELAAARESAAQPADVPVAELKALVKKWESVWVLDNCAEQLSDLVAKYERAKP